MDAIQMVQFLSSHDTHHNTTQTNTFKNLQDKERKTTQEKRRNSDKSNKRGTRDEQYLSSHDIHFSTHTVKSKGPSKYNRAVGKYLSTGGWSVRGVCKDYFTNTWEREINLTLVWGSATAVFTVPKG